MALKPKALYIAFDKGLDTYSNPHIIEAGKLTAASGVSMDRPGYVYPGPTLGPQTINSSSYASAYERYGLVSFTAQQPTSRDQLLSWSSSSGTFFSTPNIGAMREIRTDSPAGTVWPVTTSTRRVAGSLTMISTPVSALGLANGRSALFLAYVTINGSVIVLAQDVESGNVLGSTSVPAGASVPVIQLVADGAGTIYLIAQASNLQITAITYESGGSQVPFALVQRLLVNNPGTSTIDAISARPGAAANEPAYLLTYTTAGAAPVLGTYKIYTLLNSVLSAGYEPIPGSQAAFGATQSVGTLWIDDTAINSVNPTPTVLFAATGVVVAASTTTVLFVTQLPMAATSISAGYPASLTLYNGTNPALQVTGTAANVKSQNGNNPAKTGYFVAVTVSGNLYTIPGGTSTIQNTEIRIFSLTSLPFRPGIGASVMSGIMTQPGGVRLAGRAIRQAASALSTPSSMVVDVCFPISTGWGLSGGDGTLVGAQAAPTGYLIDTAARVIGSWAPISMKVPVLNESALAQSVQLPGPAGTDHITVLPYAELEQFSAVSSAGAINGKPVDAVPTLGLLCITRPSVFTASARQLGNSAIIPGGITSLYDGAYVVESGFLAPPAQPIISGVTPPAGQVALAAGTYYYVAILVYYDAAGRRHYSQPSPPASVTLAANQISQIFLQYDSVSAKGAQLGANSQLAFEVYRTVVNPGSTGTQSIQYYKVPVGGGVVGQTYPNNPLFIFNTSTTSALNSGSSLNLLTLAQLGTIFTDNVADTTLSIGRTLYTYGQTALAATTVQAPPSFSSLTVWQNCLWGLAQRNQPELWVSWPNDTSLPTPEAPTWSSANRVVLPSDIGQPLALVGLDSNLIIFGTNADYALSGSPPTRELTLLDSVGLLSAPTQLPTPGGLKLRNAITKLPTGILFQGTQGFTLLDRSLTYQPVGLAVRNFTNTGLYGPGILYPEQGCCILPPVDGISPPLTYYYFEDKWSSPAYTPAGTFQPGTAPSAPNLAQWQAVSSAVRARYTSNVPQVVTFEPDVTQSAVNVLQAGGGYLQARTPWIEMEQSSVVGSDIASVAGYGQLEEIQIQGDLLTPISHTITLQTEYDYVGNTQTPPDVQVITNVVPEVGPATAPSAPDWQFRLGFKTTLARRVRFTLTFQVTDVAVLAAGDPVVLISGLMLYYGVDDGLSRMGSSGAGYGS